MPGGSPLIAETLAQEAARTVEVGNWVVHPIGRYFVAADSCKSYEGSRAAQEAVWVWSALTEAFEPSRNLLWL